MLFEILMTYVKWSYILNCIMLGGFRDFLHVWVAICKKINPKRPNLLMGLTIFLSPIYFIMVAIVFYYYTIDVLIPGQDGTYKERLDMMLEWWEKKSKKES